MVGRAGLYTRVLCELGVEGTERRTSLDCVVSSRMLTLLRRASAVAPRSVARLALGGAPTAHRPPAVPLRSPHLCACVAMTQALLSLVGSMLPHRS